MRAEQRDDGSLDRRRARETGAPEDGERGRAQGGDEIFEGWTLGLSRRGRPRGGRAHDPSRESESANDAAASGGCARDARGTRAGREGEGETIRASRASGKLKLMMT